MSVFGPVLLVVALLGMLSACSSTRSQGDAVREPAMPRAQPTLLQQGVDAYARGDFELAALLFERERALSPADREVQYQLARAWARADRTLEAEDRIGDLLIADPDAFRARVQAEPAFDAPGFAALLRTGGASASSADDQLRSEFDVDGDGAGSGGAFTRRAATPSSRCTPLTARAIRARRLDLHWPRFRPCPNSWRAGR